jgi:hypothetical protein
MVKKCFVFKTSNTPPDYIGYNKEPNDPNGKDPNDKIFGIDMDGNILTCPGPKCKKLNEMKINGDTILLIENPAENITNLKEFHNKYGEYTSGVKLVQGTNFSSGIENLPNENSTSSKASPKKVSKKKPSKKKGGSKKNGSKKNGSKKGGSKKSKSKKKKKSKKKSKSKK